MSLAHMDQTVPLQGGQTVHIKHEPRDWRVYENLGFAFTGEGEHAYFLVEKENLNTVDVASALARACNVPLHFVGFAGLKDKRAITRQWFSVPQSGDNWPLDLPDIRCLASERHAKKLRRGQHESNYFEIRLTKTHSLAPSLEAKIADCFPNYFGPQRTSQSNVKQALAWLAKGQWGAQRGEGDRSTDHKRNNRRRKSRAGNGRGGWHLSVLRSLLFNEVLTRRVDLGNYGQAIEGDVLHEGVPTGPLWGRGRSASGGVALQVEQEALHAYADTCEALEFAGVDQARRNLAVYPQGLHIETVEDDVQLLSFSLPPGAYATSLLANAVSVVDDSKLI